MSIKYCSPSSRALFYKDRDEFYVKYCTNRALPRMPQNEPMSVGSAFDAAVKAQLTADLKGESFDDVFAQLFEAQVEDGVCADGTPLRDFALRAGKHCMNKYTKYGQYGYLLSELDTTITEIHLERGIHGKVGKGLGIDVEVPLFGFPDLYFMTNYGPVIFDWKVNGYCSKSGVSPAQGYVRSLNGSGGIKTHAKAKPEVVWGGLLIDANCTLAAHSSWPQQLCTYGWTLGFEAGHDVLVGIDQLAWRRSSEKTPLQVATHRAIIGREFQEELLLSYQRMWSAVQSGFIFFDTMDRADSDNKCRQLDEMVEVLKERRDVVDNFINKSVGW